jgi:hypothetical protein
MKYILSNRTLDGRYQTWWFLWFNILYILRIPIVFGNNLTITGFRFDFYKLNPKTGAWHFAKACTELQLGNKLKQINRDGEVIYG